MNVSLIESTKNARQRPPFSFSMDVPFGDWAKQSACASVQKYAVRLVELGASWDSFSSRDAEAIVSDLMEAGGVPLLAARDIAAAILAEIKQRNTPMAVFWDVASMPIPTGVDSRRICSRIESAIKSFGDLILFLAYNVSTFQRSDLQRSGCFIVDSASDVPGGACMIMGVDAMKFAMQHPKGAVLCVVTKNLVGGYLSVALREWRQHRVIVVSDDALDPSSCESVVSWKNEIVQNQSTPNLEKLEFENVDGEEAIEFLEGFSIAPNGQAESKDSVNCNTWVDEVETQGSCDDCQCAQSTELHDRDLVVTQHEHDDEYVYVLQAIVKEESSNSFSVLKTKVGQRLREAYPDLDLGTRRKILSDAIAKGILIESDEGPSRLISLPNATICAQSESSGFLFSMCSQCHCKMNENEVKFLGSKTGEISCPDCTLWVSSPVHTKYNAAVQVAVLLRIFASNDDIKLNENKLQDLLRSKSANRSDKWARQSIDHSKELGLIVEIGQGMVSLPDNFGEATQQDSTQNLDTSAEEEHVSKILRKEGGWTLRTKLIASLKEHFSSMSHPFARSRVFANAHRRKRFFVAKSFYGQTVGLTLEIAKASLSVLLPCNSKETAKHELLEYPDSGDGVSSDSDASSTGDAF